MEGLKSNPYLLHAVFKSWDFIQYPHKRGENGVVNRVSHYIVGAFIFVNYTISYIFLPKLYIVWSILYLNYMEKDKNISV